MTGLRRKKARFLRQCLVFACSFDASVLQVDLVRILVVFPDVLNAVMVGLSAMVFNRDCLLGSDINR